MLGLSVPLLSSSFFLLGKNENRPYAAELLEQAFKGKFYWTFIQ